MPTPEIVNKVSVKIKPYRMKFVIVGLISFIPILQGSQGFFSTIVFMWCGGLLFLSFERPTFSRIIDWYRSVFFTVWFSFLTFMTVIAFWRLIKIGILLFV